MDSQIADSVKRSVRVGVVAAAAVQFAAQVVSLGTLAVLYRLITPEEFGVLAMVLPIIYLIRNVATLGLDVATVQARQLTDDEISSLFWLNLFTGTVAAVMAMAAAPMVAWFYGQPRLLSVTLALSGTSLALALGMQHQALLERRMQLAQAAVLRLIAHVVAAAGAIGMAWAGYGVWALVLQNYCQLLVLAAAAWIAEPWRPRRPGTAPPVWNHVRVGGYFAAGGIFFFLAAHIDRVLIGRLINQRAVGLYSQASGLMMRPAASVAIPLGRIMLSSLARTASAPRARDELLAAFYRLAAVLLMPATVGLALVGDLVMRVLGGPAWVEAGPVFRVLSLTLLSQALIQMSVSVYASAGRTRPMSVAAGTLSAMVVAALVAGWYVGRQWNEPVRGVAWAYTVLILVATVPYMTLCHRVCGYRPHMMRDALARPAWATLIMAAAVVFSPKGIPEFGAWPAWGQLLAQVTVGIIVYAFVARKELHWVTAQLRQAAS